jgi:SepF-like predicted cell division protein (DUF552 family)
MRRNNHAQVSTWPPDQGGPTRGSRNKLASDFLKDLHTDWLEHGAAAIKIMRIERPSEYVKVVAAILPRDLSIEVSAVTELDDDDLERMIELLREHALATRQEQTLELNPAPKALLNGH